MASGQSPRFPAELHRQKPAAVMEAWGVRRCNVEAVECGAVVHVEREAPDGVDNSEGARLAARHQ